MKLSWLLAVLFLVNSAMGTEIKGRYIPDQIEVGGKTLALNGTGIRKKTIFAVDVYIGALYLETKSSDAAAILSSPEIKRVELIFVHDAAADKIRDAWNDALQDNCSSNCAVFRPSFDQLNLKMVDLKVGDRMAFDFYPDHVELWVKSKDVGAIRDRAFPVQLLKTWLGSHPPTDELKAGMLGKK